MDNVAYQRIQVVKAFQWINAQTVLPDWFTSQLQSEITSVFGSPKLRFRSSQSGERLVNPSDWICIDNAAFVFVVDKEYFQFTYKVITEDDALKLYAERNTHLLADIKRDMSEFTKEEIKELQVHTDKDKLTAKMKHILACINWKLSNASHIKPEDMDPWY